ncbi:MAG: agmatinase [Anaerolineae bacterium]|nr:agmatinase [Anaerolineae bacterium]
MKTIRLIGIPYDEHSSYQRGSAWAPPVIREALYNPSSNMWSETGMDVGAPGFIFDAGDVPVADGVEAIAQIEAAMLAQVRHADPVLALGGDHAITYPLVRAAAQQNPDLTILHIDAHPDIYDEFEGDRFSHACPFARIMEEGLVKRLIQVGIRTMNGHCREQAKRFGVEVIEMKDFDEKKLPVVNSPVYLSLDMDGLDPAFAPGVSHREPGGLNVRQVINLIRHIDLPLVAADIVEFNPRRDVQDLTAMLCAKFVKEITAQMVYTNREKK